MKLGEVSKVQGGYAFKSQEFQSEGVPIIRIGNLDGKGVGIDYDVCYPREFWEEHPEFRIEKNSILIAMSGATVGKVGLFESEEKALLNQRVCILRPNENAVANEYLYFYCLSPTFKKQIEENAFGCAQPNISASQICNFEINVPTKDEQRKCIEQLQKLKKIIFHRERELLEFDNLIKSRFVELFGDPETNPYGWEKVTVGDVCSSIVRGPFGSALKKEFFVEPNETTYKVYEQKHAIQKSAIIGNYYVTAEKFDELRRFECVAGDILMSCSGTMGELYQLPEGCEKGLINQALCKFTLNEKILPVIFLTYMEQTIGNLETKGSGIQNIAAVSYVKAMPINLAPMDIQEQFAAFAKQVDKLKFVFTISQRIYTEGGNRFGNKF